MVWLSEEVVEEPGSLGCRLMGCEEPVREEVLQLPAAVDGILCRPS